MLDTSNGSRTVTGQTSIVQKSVVLKPQGQSATEQNETKQSRLQCNLYRTNAQGSDADTVPEPGWREQAEKILQKYLECLVLPFDFEGKRTLKVATKLALDEIEGVEQ